MLEKEVLIVDMNGTVYTKATDNRHIRHDILAGEIVKDIYEPDYQIKDSMLDNGRYLCEEYNCMVIYPDIRDLVALFPENLYPKQAKYYLDNFIDERDIRIHVMQRKDGKYIDLTDEELRSLLTSLVPNETLGR